MAGGRDVGREGLLMKGAKLGEDKEGFVSTNQFLGECLTDEVTLYSC